MVTQMSRSALRPYAAVVATTAGQAVVTGAWLWAGELPPRKRRLARLGLTTTITAAAVVRSRFPSAGDGAELSDDPEGDQSAADQVEPGVENEDPARQRPALAGLAATGIAVTTMIGSSMLQKRWLARLARNGHPRPHRALALRVAGISFAGSLPARLMKTHEQAGTGLSRGR